MNTISKVFILLAAVASFVLAVEPKTRENYGIYMVQHNAMIGTNNVGGSTITVPGQLLAWTVYSKGADVTFQIKTSSGSAFKIQESSSVTVLNGNIMTDDVRSVVRHPLFLISTMSAIGNATSYFTFTYLKNE